VRLTKLKNQISPILVFDGGCPFCRHFAELSELRSGIAGLKICDGRLDHDLRWRLQQGGLRLRDGAFLIVGDQQLHGAEAIQWICSRMTPSAGLLNLLAPLLARPGQARLAYPLLLLARRIALGLRGLSADPDRFSPGSAGEF